MRAYGQLLRRPGTKVPAAAAFVARLPFGMTPLALVLLVEATLGSYTAAGLVSGAHALGIGVAGPLQGRLVDRFGQARVLVPCALVYVVLLSGLVALTRPGPVLPLAGLALVTGMAFPPIAACARVAWSWLLRGSPLRDTAYALDSVIVELSFVCGPLVVATILAFATPAAAVVAAGLCAAAGTLVFAASGASRGAGSLTDGERGPARALQSRAVGTVVVAFAVMSVAFGVIEVGIPSFADTRGSASSAGVMLSSLAAGSLLGGLLYGARRWPGQAGQRYRVLLLTFAVGLLLLPLASTVAVMIGALFVSGFALAPLVISAYLVIEENALAGTATEAFSWTTTANVVGTAAGAALAGVLADRAGPQASLAPAAVAVGLAAVFAFATRRSIPPSPAPARLDSPAGPKGAL